MYQNELAKQQKARVRLAIAFGVVGLLTIALLFFVQDSPDPLWLWALFAGAFVFFEWNTVEVNDKLFASPSVMVIMTAAVVFGPESAILGCAVMAALGPLQPADIRERRWFQPAVNFGQLVLSATAAVSLYVLVVGPYPITGSSVWRVALASALAAIV